MSKGDWFSTSQVKPTQIISKGVKLATLRCVSVKGKTHPIHVVVTRDNLIKGIYIYIESLRGCI